MTPYHSNTLCWDHCLGQSPTEGDPVWTGKGGVKRGTNKKETKNKCIVNVGSKNRIIFGILH